MKTLENIEGKWVKDIPVEGYSSPLEVRVYKLYNKDLNAFTIDDLRFMLIQQIGIKVLVEKAVSCLEEDILVDATYYEGDLLNSVLSVSESYWKENINHYNKLKTLIINSKERLEKELKDVNASDRTLLKNIKSFLEITF
jgi:hypothetical protein